jgi:hypothetical protein
MSGVCGDDSRHLGVSMENTKGHEQSRAPYVCIARKTKCLDLS